MINTRSPALCYRVAFCTRLGWRRPVHARSPTIFIDERGSELDTSYTNFIQDQICLANQIGAPAWGWSAAGIPPYEQEYCGYGCIRDDLLVPHASLLAADHVPASVLVKNLRALESLNVREAGNQRIGCLRLWLSGLRSVADRPDCGVLSEPRSGHGLPRSRQSADGGQRADVVLPGPTHAAGHPTDPGLRGQL